MIWVLEAFKAKILAKVKMEFKSNFCGFSQFIQVNFPMINGGHIGNRMRGIACKSVWFLDLLPCFEAMTFAHKLAVLIVLVKWSRVAFRVKNSQSLCFKQPNVVNIARSNDRSLPILSVGLNQGLYRFAWANVTIIRMAVLGRARTHIPRQTGLMNPLVKVWNSHVWPPFPAYFTTQACGNQTIPRCKHCPSGNARPWSLQWSRQSLPKDRRRSS